MKRSDLHYINYTCAQLKSHLQGVVLFHDLVIHMYIYKFWCVFLSTANSYQ